MPARHGHTWTEVEKAELYLSFAHWLKDRADYHGRTDQAIKAVIRKVIEEKEQ